MSSQVLPPYPHVPGAEDFHAAAASLLAWYQRFQRPLPWRKDYHPYKVWISEIMLQQTQMDRVIHYFKRWMERFPTIEILAESSLDQVNKAWEGLGYYNRAKNLHACAQVICSRHQGIVPADPDALMKLPGIGRYTAGAVSSIAYNLPHPAVDANVERVFSRLFDVDTPTKSREGQTFFWATGRALIPQGQARVFNQALMELGALLCGKKADCEPCPMRPFCQAAHLGLSKERPLLARRQPTESLPIATGILIFQQHLFIQKRLDSGAWAGLWEFPGGRIEVRESPEEAVLREFLEETDYKLRIRHKLGLVHHAYTRYRIALHCFLVEFSDPVDPQSFPEPLLRAASAYHWARLEELDRFAFPAGHRKLLDLWKDLLAQAVRS